MPLLLSVAVWISVMSMCVCDVPYSEVSSLNDLYFATNGFAWRNNRNWLNGDPCSGEWVGVTCDASNTHVTQLEFHENRLSGTLPSSLSLLSKLEDLSVTDTSLSGTLPPSMGMMTSLVSLAIQNNVGLTGPIPASFGGMRSLATLILNRNNLTGPLPAELSGATLLSNLQAHANQLSGTLPSHYQALPLDSLYLNNNYLSGTVGVWVCSISRLDMSENRFWCPFPACCSASCGHVTSCFPNPILSHTPNLVVSALVELYVATRGPFWEQNQNWAKGDPCGNRWYGVKCDDAGDIISLNLQGNKLIGTIPSSIGLVTTLRFLSLTQNRISGTIPASLADLTSLESLDWEDSSLSGTLPSSIGNIRTLSSLYLSLNSLSGSLPTSLGFLTRLTYFWARNNRLSGSIPTQIGLLKQLEFIDLKNNSFDGTLPSELVSLTHLEAIEVSNNKISGTLPDQLRTLPLGRLLLSNNRLSGTVTFWVCNVRAHSLTHNFFSCPLPKCCADQCDGCPPSSSDLPSPSPPPSASSQWSALEDFYYALGGPQWTQKTNWLTGDPCDARWFGVEKCDGENVFVTNLELLGNGLRGTIPDTIQRLTSLNELSLSISYPSSGTIPASVGAMASLTYLRLEISGISGTIPSFLGNLYNLQMLILKSRLSGTMPSELWNLKKLIMFKVNVYSLSGTIPSEIGTLTLLRSLDLSGNRLSGSIPSEIVSLSSLQWLNLDNNALTGSLSLSLPSMTSLRTVSLRRNWMSGTIPSEYENVKFLLDISDNSFSGFLGQWVCESDGVVLSGNRFWCPFPQCCSIGRCGTCVSRPTPTPVFIPTPTSASLSPSPSTTDKELVTCCKYVSKETNGAHCRVGETLSRRERKRKEERERERKRERWM